MSLKLNIINYNKLMNNLDFIILIFKDKTYNEPCLQYIFK